MNYKVSYGRGVSLKNFMFLSISIKNVEKMSSHHHDYHHRVVITLITRTSCNFDQPRWFIGVVVVVVVEAVRLRTLAWRTASESASGVSHHVPEVEVRLVH